MRPGPNQNHQGLDSDDDPEIYEESVQDNADENPSVGGMERAGSSSSGGTVPNSKVVSRSQRGQGVLQVRNNWLEDMTNKLLPPEETDVMVQRLVKQADEQFKRTYVRGVPAGEVDESAVVLRVGLPFLPGADKPQVNRLEQTYMTGKVRKSQEAVTFCWLLLHPFIQNEWLRSRKKNSTELH